MRRAVRTSSCTTTPPAVGRGPAPGCRCAPPPSPSSTRWPRSWPGRPCRGTTTTTATARTTTTTRTTSSTTRRTRRRTRTCPYPSTRSVWYSEAKWRRRSSPVTTVMHNRALKWNTLWLWLYYTIVYGTECLKNTNLPSAKPKRLAFNC